MKISFGTYAGQDLKDVPLNYLHWALTHVKISLPMRAEINRILAERNFFEDGDDVLWFGRYAGYRFEEVPLSYLSWALATVTLPEAAARRIRALLAEADYPENGHQRPKEAKP